MIFQDRSTLDVLVENHGRVNYIEYGSNRFNEERKGKETHSVEIFN